MKFELMYKISKQCAWIVKHFEHEEEAMAAAHGIRDNGAVMVEVYQKSRVGYRKVWQHRSNSV